ncbi:DDB1- and CUL4-associated factor 4-like [Chenopodium quinoa]|uniref:DDB1- and CUL4-associated factor 4-like n=1 Tax=Chenopodium quinoa TaxID=63459 RepID=UPI000B7873A3|nr:DDB1- and CUL4-associated factor 4-like [Chenopodium quinoa]
MPQDLPGFYYDPDKNRYFPIKGPIPGSSRKPKSVLPDQNSVSLPTQVPSKLKKDFKISKLLQCRELYGSTVDLSDRKGSFQEECKKKLVSKPKIWKYQDVEKDADCSLALTHITVETPEGQCAADALITGGMNGSLSLFDVGDVGRHGHKTAAEFVWPEQDDSGSYQTLKDIWKFNGSTLIMPSSISSISLPRKEYDGADNYSSARQHALITTLGSDLSGGALYILNLADPVDLISNFAVVGRLCRHVSLNCTIWGAETSHTGHKAVVGTSLGATLVDLESGVSSTLCRSKSDVLSVKFIQSGNVALCGLRKGAIITVDVRQQQRHLARHSLLHPSDDSNRPGQKRTKPFVLKGNIQPSSTVYMPSSICCLASLQMYDQYFLASSMNGSIYLYDHRLTKRGPVQSYEGHVNSHSHIKLATDASERYLMSGGEDCKVRIWNIKSGEMLFKEKLSSCVPMAACWQGSAGNNADAWLGSAEGLLRMQFCI